MTEPRIADDLQAFEVPPQRLVVVSFLVLVLIEGDGRRLGG